MEREVWVGEREIWDELAAARSRGKRSAGEGGGVRVRVRVWVVGLQLGEGVRAAVGSGSIRRRLMHDPRDMPMD